jgi:4-amino-4-deoxy-L-arabinose transferase-like glycosyltransferase
MLNRIILTLRNLNERQTLLLLLGLTFGLRLCVVLMAKELANDSAGYGFMARDFMKGQYAKGLSYPFHPFYPWLISLFSPSASSVELTGRLISLFWGTVTLLPVYLLVKQAVGQKTATFAGLFYALHPALITYSGLVLSEATYWGLLTLAVYLFWMGLRRDRLLESMASSLPLALAYLTRPEGAGYLVVFILWAAIAGGLAKGWARKAVLIAGLVCLFVGASFPYLLEIRRETGHWLISKKALETQVRYLTVEQTKQEMGRPSLEKRPAERRKPPTIARRIVRRLGGIVSNVIQYLPFTIYHYLKAYHAALWIFLFFGLIRKRQEGEDRRYEWFLGSVVLFHQFSLATFIPSISRFSLPLIPISLLWAGAGILPLQRFLKGRGVSEPAGWIALMILLGVLILLPIELRGVREVREEQRVAGQWLKENTPPDAVIMSNSPREAFYAEREFVDLPPASPFRKDGGPSYQDVMSFARGRGAQYLLVNQDTEGYNRSFFESVSTSQWQCVYRWDDQKKFIIIYRLPH